MSNPFVKEFAYVTPQLLNADIYNYDKITQATVASDVARIKTQPVGIYGVQPSIFESLLPDFLDVNYKSNSALSMGEQLYTPRGSQSFGSGKYLQDELNVKAGDFNDRLLIRKQS